MTDKPILFSAPMVRALLDGRKTQTRRAVKIKDHLANHTFTGELVDYYGNGRLGMVVDGSTLVQPVPYAPGDRIWVKETWRARDVWDDDSPRHIHRSETMQYEATDPKPNGRQLAGRKRSSIHMPRWASRLTLTVTDVRVQRLQEISEADAQAEGVLPHRYGTARNPSWTDYKTSFEWLWESINGLAAWDANPWVVALTFNVHRCNIDTMQDAA